MPRIEPAPDLVERVLSRARRASAVPDRYPVAVRPWIPVTAAVAVLLLALPLVMPWVGLAPRPRRETPAVPRLVGQTLPPRAGEAVPGQPVAAREESHPSAPPEKRELTASLAIPGVPDSLFDHSEDVEFILDPVTLHRGRASMSRAPAGARGEKAVISF